MKRGKCDKKFSRAVDFIPDEELGIDQEERKRNKRRW
jgi:hypothetical protein